MTAHKFEATQGPNQVYAQTSTPLAEADCHGHDGDSGGVGDL